MAALTINQGDASLVVTGCKMARKGAKEEGRLILLGGSQEHSPIVSLLMNGVTFLNICPPSLLPLFFESSLAFSLSLSSLVHVAARPGAIVPVMGKLVGAWPSSLPGPSSSPSVAGCWVSQPASTAWLGLRGGGWEVKPVLTLLA